MDELGGLSPLVCREAALFAALSTDARVEDVDTEAVAEKLELEGEKAISRRRSFLGKG